MATLHRGGQFRSMLLLGSWMISVFSASQQSPDQLVRLQLSKAYLDISSNVVHAQGLNGVTYGNPGDVWSYPNSLSCVVVYSDGRYVIEKREERTLGKPKVKSAEGTLNTDDLQNLKQLLDDDALKTVKTPKMPELPSDTQAIREVESLDAQINHQGSQQHFTTVRERVKTGATNSMTATASNGMDTYLDNGTAYKKALNPLMKWFESLDKKSKSSFKDSKPQYCVPMNIG